MYPPPHFPLLLLSEAGGCPDDCRAPPRSPPSHSGLQGAFKETTFVQSITGSYIEISKSPQPVMAALGRKPRVAIWPVWSHPQGVRELCRGRQAWLRVPWGLARTPGRTHLRPGLDARPGAQLSLSLSVMGSKGPWAPSTGFSPLHPEPRAHQDANSQGKAFPRPLGTCPSLGSG